MIWSGCGGGWDRSRGVLKATGGGHGKLASVSRWIEGHVAARDAITLDELVADQAETPVRFLRRIAVLPGAERGKKWRQLHLADPV
jgi:hypothetical protein